MIAYPPLTGLSFSRDLEESLLLRAYRHYYPNHHHHLSSATANNTSILTLNVFVKTIFTDLVSVGHAVKLFVTRLQARSDGSVDTIASGRHCDLSVCTGTSLQTNANHHAEQRSERFPLRPFWVRESARYCLAFWGIT